MKKKIKTFKYPYEFLISEDFLSKKNLENFFLLNNSLKKKSQDVQRRLNNKNLSSKRNILRFVENNKIIEKKNTKKWIFYKQIKNNINYNLDKKIYKPLNINKKIISKGTMNISICWDKPGYKASPHTDSERKIWTGIIYLFDDDTNKSGTKILKKNKGKSSFKSIKTIIPKINRFFALKRSNISYHSVAKSKKNRIIILINFNYKNNIYEK